MRKFCILWWAFFQFLSKGIILEKIPIIITIIIDDRIVECGITSLVHEEVSPYQKIQILHTIDFGRLVSLQLNIYFFYHKKYI